MWMIGLRYPDRHAPCRAQLQGVPWPDPLCRRRAGGRAQQRLAEVGVCRHDPTADLPGSPPRERCAAGAAHRQPRQAGPNRAAVQWASAAKAAGFTVFTIGLGNDMDFDALPRISSRPEYFYHAPDAAQLARTYSTIAVRVPCLPGSFWGGR